MKTKERKMSAVETFDGANARIKRLFPTERLMNYDPFVLLDEFFLDPSAGFPPHPHRGFEAVTYMLEGSFRHRDTLGNDTTVGPGGVQRFTAGSGIEHSEMPGNGGMNHGIQLWINLPQKLKDVPPEYQQVDPGDIPEKRSEGTIARTIIGKGSPVLLRTGAYYADVTLQSGRHLRYAPPEGFRGFVYLVTGALTAGAERLAPGDALFFGTEETLDLDSTEDARFLVIAGIPHNEPIHQHGSFVD